MSSEDAPTLLRWLWSPWTLAVAVAGLTLRWWVLGSPLGFLNADEAYTGLQALGVLDGRFPVVIDGNVYTAVLECYVFAPLVALMDGSAVGLKLLFIGLWALAAVVTAGAARRVAGGLAGAVAGAVVWLAPGALMVVSTRAYVGYALGVAVVAATIWAAAEVADQHEPSVAASAVAGGLAGLAVYVHPMFATVIVPTMAVPAIVHRRELRRWWLPAGAAALAANSAFLAWNAVNGWPSLHHVPRPPGTWAERLRGFATGLLPRVLGVRSHGGDWVHGRLLGLVVYAAVLTAVVIGCVLLMRSGRWRSRWIVPVTLGACFPAMALLPPLIYVADGRYGVIPLPYLSIALGAAAAAALGRARRSTRHVLAAGAATTWLVVTLVPFLVHDAGTRRIDPNARTGRVIEVLDEAGIERVAGSYWWVLPIEYLTDRRIRSAVAGEPFVVRFPTSQRLVEQSPPDEVAFVFSRSHDQPHALYRPPGFYERIELGAAVVYLPRGVG